VRFLADESCDAAVARALRGAGHDVLAVGDVARGAEDEAVIALARHQRRILLTEDKDFGHLVYASRVPSGGVILLRYPVAARIHLLHTLLQLVRRRGEALADRFVVLQPGRVRIRRRPGP
jgi:predicted nuclease of predicted toxin-antitoxin system